jgi:hypothetical protein
MEKDTKLASGAEKDKYGKTYIEESHLRNNFEKNNPIFQQKMK